MARNHRALTNCEYAFAALAIVSAIIEVVAISERGVQGAIVANHACQAEASGTSIAAASSNKCAEHFAYRELAVRFVLRTCLQLMNKFLESFVEGGCVLSHRNLTKTY